jgi:glycosyltransferase involved in cell wall biosynthesis
MSERQRQGSRRNLPPGVLLYGMYDMSGIDRAPTVRIQMMAAALGRLAHTERITGGRIGRFGAAVRWMASGGPRRVGAVYVESATASAMPTDLAFLALMRLLRRPVGVYFRDAYPLFRGIHPRQRRRQVLSDLAWRMSTPLLAHLATVRYVPSHGLAEALGFHDAVLLPPGTDAAAPDLGVGEPDVVGAIAQIAPGTGFESLLAAMELVRKTRLSARLRLVTRTSDPVRLAAMPAWVDAIDSGREGLADALRPCRVCVLPLPVNAYTNLAVSVRLLDLIGYGKPVVATDTDESRAVIEASGAGAVCPATAQGLADAILSVLGDESLARRLAASARRYAAAPGSTWEARARLVIESAGLAVRPRPEAGTGPVEAGTGPAKAGS